MEINDENSELKSVNSVTTASSIMNKVNLFLTPLLLIGMVALFFLWLKSPKSETPTTPQAQTNSAASIPIAYINSDSLWENYEFVKDVKQQLVDFETKLQSRYNAKTKAFEADYKSSLDKANRGLLTTREKDRVAEELQRKQQDILELDKELSAQLMEKKEKANTQVQDTILAFIKKFNQDSKYLYILEYSKLSGILYADESKDITTEIVKGLNENYIKFKDNLEKIK